MAASEKCEVFSLISFDTGKYDYVMIAREIFSFLALIRLLGKVFYY